MNKMYKFAAQFLRPKCNLTVIALQLCYKVHGEFRDIGAVPGIPDDC